MSSSSSDSSDCLPCRAHVVDLCKKVKKCENDPLVEIINSNIPQEQKLELVAQLKGRCHKPCHRERHVDRFLKTISKIYDNQTAVGYACDKATWNTFPESLLNYASLIIYLRLVGAKNYSKPHSFECGQLEIGQFVYEAAGPWKWTVKDRTTGKTAFFDWAPEKPVVTVFETENSSLNSLEVKAQGYVQVDCDSTECPCDSTPDTESTDYFSDCKPCQGSDTSPDSSVTAGAGCVGCGDVPYKPACDYNQCCDGFSNIDQSCITKSLLCKIKLQREQKHCKPKPLCPCKEDSSSSSSSSDSSSDCKPCKLRNETHEQRRERRTRSRHERHSRRHECHERESRSREQCAQIRISVCAQCDSSSSSYSTEEKCYERELSSVLPPVDFILVASSEGACNRVVLRKVGAVFTVEREGFPVISSEFAGVGILGIQKLWNANIMSFPLGKEVRLSLKVADLEEQVVVFTLAPPCKVENDDQAEFDIYVEGNEYKFNVEVQDWRRTVLNVIDLRPRPCPPKPCDSSSSDSSSFASESVSPEDHVNPQAYVLKGCFVVPVIDAEIETEGYEDIVKKLNCLLKEYQQGPLPSPESWSYSSWSSSDDLCEAYQT